MNKVITTTIDLSDKSLNRSANIAKALGHPVRIAILKILAEQDTCFCGDITRLIPLAQSTVSQHLKALKQAGLIQGEVDGVQTCYCLDPHGIKELNNLLNALSEELMNPMLKNCC